MKSSAKKVELAPYDDLFSTEESRQDAKLEKVREIPLSELHPFKNHPFKVKDDEAMMETADSIKQYGVLVPAIARPDPEGGYELVAGHRRHRASELAEKETMPVIVRDLDDDVATILELNQDATLSLYASTDIGIHYEGWTLEDTKKFWNNYGITNDDAIESIFELIVEEPAHYLKYYVGYMEFVDLKEKAQETYGSAYSDIAFHKALLSIGPAPFSIIETYLDDYYLPDAAPQ